MRIAIIVTVLAGLIVPAVAQTRLPRTSPSEREVNRINRSINQEQRLQRLEQQIQIDNNQLRQNIDRQRNISSPVRPGRIGTCPAGSIGC